jgi:hypothetical protein
MSRRVEVLAWPYKEGEVNERIRGVLKFPNAEADIRAFVIKPNNVSPFLCHLQGLHHVR